MVFCSVPGCYSNNNDRPTERKFYNYPADPKRISKWQFFCGDKRVISRTMRHRIFICDLHFVESDFFNPKDKLSLKHFAVPSINGPLNIKINEIVSLQEPNDTNDLQEPNDPNDLQEPDDSNDLQEPNDPNDYQLNSLLSILESELSDTIDIQDETKKDEADKDEIKQSTGSSTVHKPTSGSTKPDGSKKKVVKTIRRFRLTPLQKQHKTIYHFQRKQGLKKYKRRKKRVHLNINDPKYSIAATAESLGTFNTSVPYHENMIDLDNGEWAKLYSPELSNVSDMSNRDVGLMINQLRAKIHTLSDRDKLEVSFLLSMLSSYTEAPERIKTLLIQRLKMVYIATLFQWSTSLSLFNKSRTCIPVKSIEEDSSTDEESTSRSRNKKHFAFEIIVQEKCPVSTKIQKSDVNGL